MAVGSLEEIIDDQHAIVSTVSKELRPITAEATQNCFKG